MENFANAELKLVSEMKKNELAFEFVENSEKIEKLKKALKELETRNSEIEAVLVGQISPKYQPTGAKFVLLPKVSKGRKSTSYASVVDETPKACNLDNKQIALLSDLLASHTKIGEDKVSIQIAK